MNRVQLKSAFNHSPLPWNVFRSTYIEFRNQLIITTSKFTEDWINEENRTRLETIWKLYKRGWRNREITDFLNIFGIKKINSAGRLKLTEQYNDPGYVESSFPQKESFWIFIKNPPKGEYAVNYATFVCNQAKNNNDAKGFIIIIWGLLDKMKNGKFPCY